MVCEPNQSVLLLTCSSLDQDGWVDHACFVFDLSKQGTWITKICGANSLCCAQRARLTLRRPCGWLLCSGRTSLTPWSQWTRHDMWHVYHLAMANQNFKCNTFHITTLSNPHVGVAGTIRIVLGKHPRRTSSASVCPLTCCGEDLCNLIIESKATTACSWVGNPRSPTSFVALQPITGNIVAQGTTGLADSHHIIHFCDFKP